MNDFDKLQVEAAALDAEVLKPTDPLPAPEPPPGDAPPEPVLSPLEEARSLIDVIVSVATPLLPAIETIYGDDARARLAKVSAPLMQKYGWSVGGAFAKWKEEIDFAFVAVPLVLATMKAWKADQERKKGDTAAKGEGAKTAPASNSEAVFETQPANE